MRVIIQAEALRRSEKTHHHHFIHELPTIEAVPVVHGRWVFDRPNHYKCSVCDAMWSGVARFMKFCPNCGAKMDAKEDENA